MKKRIVLFLLLCMFPSIFCSCTTAFQKTIDEKTGFSTYLKETENHIRNEEWHDAMTSLHHANEAWEKLKPIMQIDIDHDYVNDMENNLTLLDGYIQTKAKPDSLAMILLIQQDWEDIGTM